MKRRQFLQTSLLAATVPAIVPASVLGRNGNVPPSDRIVMGCIGVGGQGTYNMKAFLNRPEVQVVAVCDVNKGKADRTDMYSLPYASTGGISRARHTVAQHYGTSDSRIAAYTDFRELLARSDIDAVTVCTPDHWHGLITIAAARAGKDIYCEKPLANSVVEGRAVCDAVQRYQRVLQTGSHERSNDSVRFACELVRNGRIGKLEEIHVNMPNRDHHHILLLNNQIPTNFQPVPDELDYDMWLGPAGYKPFTPARCFFWWRFIMEYGGGEITDRGAHILDIAQFINDADDSGPIAIEAHGRILQGPLFNAFIEYQFTCTYKNGVKILGGSTGQRGLKLVGSDGWIFIHIHGGRLEASDAKLLTSVIGPNEIHVGRSPEHHQNFLHAVRTRTNPVAPAEIGHRTATLCHLLNIAMLLDRPLKWDPHYERIIGDDEANRLLSPSMRQPWSLV